MGGGCRGWRGPPGCATTHAHTPLPSPLRLAAGPLALPALKFLRAHSLPQMPTLIACRPHRQGSLVLSDMRTTSMGSEKSSGAFNRRRSLPDLVPASMPTSASADAGPLSLATLPKDEPAPPSGVVSPAVEADCPRPPRLSEGDGDDDEVVPAKKQPVAATSSPPLPVAVGGRAAGFYRASVDGRGHSTTARDGGPQRPKVLIAEDDKMSRALITRILQRCGYEARRGTGSFRRCHTPQRPPRHLLASRSSATRICSLPQVKATEDGEQCFQAFVNSGPVDLIVTDINMCAPAHLRLAASPQHLFLH